MLVERFVNELMSSNCYVVYDLDSKRCLIIDPASESSEREIQFIKDNNLFPDYIILTHEHTDHTWGVNSLLEQFPDVKIAAHSECARLINKESRSYFLFYYNDPSYSYKVSNIDIQITSEEQSIEWNNKHITFIYTPGHSSGSMCIAIDEMLFTGDTLMQFKPYIPRKGGSKEDFAESLDKLKRLYINDKTFIWPGHGDGFKYCSYENL